MKKLLIVLSLAILSLNLTGCPSSTVASTPTVQAQIAVTQTLNALGVALKATPGILDTLYTNGKITKDTYNAAANVYNQTIASYKLAVSALNTTVAAGQDPNTSTAYLSALFNFTTNQDNLNNLIAAMGGK